MKIKRIEILGFKSFVDQVVLDIPEGVTGIVGPNGCGKSNVVDAIRWAMGEQSAKNLRGRAMEDVIFGGSETRKPHGMAEVSIVFDNADGLAPAGYRDYAEIMVTRRLFRNGESDYLINKSSCRLLDIAELFLDTGVGKRAYSIIEQGKIGQILNAKPGDRRFLIEEAAGVSKFKARKQTAERKIEGTKQNLLRLADIIGEVKRHLGSLKRQAQKAERFRQFREELRALETAQAKERLTELQQCAKGARSEEIAQSRLAAELAGDMERGELDLSELRLQQTHQEKNLSGVQEQVYQLGVQIQEVEGKIALSVREQQNHGRQQERAAAEQVEVQRRLAETEIQLQEGQSLTAELAQTMERAKLDLELATEAADEASQAETAGALQVEQFQQQLLQLVHKQSELQSRQADTERRLELAAERKQRNQTEASALQSQLQHLQESRQQLLSELAGSQAEEAELAGQQQELKSQQQRLRQEGITNEGALLKARTELNRHQSRLESLQRLERNLEGYANGVQQVLNNKPLAGDFQGMVADALVVPDHLEVAVEALLGTGLQALLARGREEVDRAFSLLDESGGRCTFLLPQPSSEVSQFSAGEPLLSHLQVSDPRLEQLFAGVYLVADPLDFISRPLPPGLVLVSRDGLVLTSSGQLSGGKEAALQDGVLQRKREMRDLGTLVAESEARTGTLDQQRSSVQEQIQRAEEKLQKLLEQQHQQALKVMEGSKDLARFESEEQRIGERATELNLELEQLHAEQGRLSRLQSGFSDHTEERQQIQRQLEADLNRQRQQQDELNRVLDRERERLTGCKVEVAGLREREEAARQGQVALGKLGVELRGRIALLTEQQDEAAQDQERLGQERIGLQAELETLFARQEEVKALYGRERDAFEVQSSQITEHEARLRQLRQVTTEAREVLNRLQLHVREQELAIDHLCQSFAQRYQIDLVGLPQTEGDFEQEKGEQRIAELQRAIAGVGEVNLTAIEEYQELDERYQFLTRQQTDLRQSLEGLQAAIVKINHTTRKRFQVAFEAINGKFQEVFPRLFRGGRAELRLTDSEDLLESGIDIIAQPPGKKLQNVSLLSGGEKALTAVSLIFAIFLIKPSPFCLLDEVDAPLDDANIGRFNDLVAEMSSTSQFILITHNQRTMKVADTLYGITMEEPGVSKLVSVRLSQLEQE